jgi:molybdopterin converting factor small subunit
MHAIIIFFERTAHPMHVEFLAFPRRLAGVSEIEVQAETLGQLLRALAEQFPSFGMYIISDRLHPSFIANLNGNEFVRDPHTVLHKDDHVLILSADAGG